MIGIYCIENTKTLKKYVGKSKDINSRFSQHKYSLKKGKHHNQYLQNAYNKDGKKYFRYYVLETMEDYEPIKLAFKEMVWIDKLKTLDSEHGYNLLYDSPQGYIVHNSTRKKQSEINSGEKNPNYGNNWTDEQKEDMSNIAKKRHASGLFYNDEWKGKLSKAAIKTWSDLDKRKTMAENVSKSKTNSDFFQYTKEGNLVAVWEDIHQILLANPGWKWQNIYATCNGSKKSYQGFIWKREPKQSGKWMFYTPDGAFDDQEEWYPVEPLLE